ncbi:hypothetical protein ACYSNV_04240 [Myroides sp. LJL119]
MSNIQNKLNQINQQGLDLDFTTIMQSAFAYYKKTFLSVASALMLIGFCVSFLSSFLLIKFIGDDPQAIEQMLLDIDPYNFTPYQTGLYLLIGSCLTAIASIFTAGLIKMNNHVDTQERLTMFTGLSYFIKKQGLKVFIAQFCISIVFSSISFALQLLGLNVVALGINWFINILLVFVVPLIIFGDLGSFQAIKNSVLVVNKQPLTIILVMLCTYSLLIMLILMLVSSGLGPFFLILGVFLTVPFLFSVFYSLYKQAIGVGISDPNVTQQHQDQVENQDHNQDN